MEEKVAINLADASIPDNEHQQPSDEVLIEDGLAAYFSTLPLKA
jgi:pyroglutamyl-peptidase